MYDQTKFHNRFSPPESVGRVLLTMDLFYIYSVLIFTNIFWGVMGGSLAVSGWFWLFQLAMIGIGGLIIKYYQHPLTILTRIPYIAFTVYLTARMLVPEFWEYRPAVFILGIVNYLILGYNFVITIIQLVRLGKTKQFGALLLGNLKSRKIKWLTGIAVLWLVLSTWAYAGFSQRVTIVDPYVANECPMRVSFYGYPFGSTIVDYYNTVMWDVEAEYYRSMNSTFVLPMGSHFGKPDAYAATLANLSIIFHAWGDKGIPFMIDLNPYNHYLNDGDFYVYYYIAYMEDALDRVVAWVEENNFTNFRGIEIDPEGPRLSVDDTGKPMRANATQHALAAVSIQAKFDAIRERHPDWIFTTISVTNAIYDWVDGDRDADILTKTISAEPLVVDYYGWQTYMVQPDRYSSAHFYEACKIGKNHYGQKFVPWIGWLNSYGELANNPTTYVNALTQLKICKSLQLDEVYFAPSRYFLGPVSRGNYTAHSQAMARLAEFNRTLHEPFAPVEIPYTQNRILFTDFPLWVEKAHPGYFNVNENLYYDILCDVQGGWVMWMQFGFIGFLYGIILLKRKQTQT
jgi:hypothetical protein